MFENRDYNRECNKITGRKPEWIAHVTIFWKLLRAQTSLVAAEIKRIGCKMDKFSKSEGGTSLALIA